LITRLSYAAGLPTDRLKSMVQTLVRSDLIRVRIEGLPLQGNISERRHYHIVKKGLEFLESYRKIQGLITYLETEHRRQSDLPMDIVDSA